MTENKISGLYIALILGSIMAIGGIIFQGDLLAHYGKTSPDLAYLNKSQEISNQIINVTASMKRNPPTGIAPLDAFIVGIYETTRLFWSLGDLYTTFLTSVAGAFGIPSIMVALIISLVFAIITFSIIAIITNRNV